MSETLATPSPLRSWGVGLVVLGATGLAAAFTLTVERFRLLVDPAYRPSCDLNPVLSCGSVMVTDQASLFGFPNPLLGIAGFAVVVTIGVVLASGAMVPRWILGGLALGAAAGGVLVHWLIFQSLYRINALCPWCMVVWTVTFPIVVWSILIGAGGRDGPRPVAALWSVRYLVVLFWYLAVAVLILERFWDYWSTLI